MRMGRRDTHDPSQVGQDGSTTPARQPAKAGDLSNFGKISKSTTMQFGPSSIFSNNDDKQESASTRASSANIFALNANEATPDVASVGSRTASSSQLSSQKNSVDFSPGSVADGREKLFLQPRTQAATSVAGSFQDDAGSAKSEQGDDDAADATVTAAQMGMSTEHAKRKITENIEGWLMLRQPSEADGYLSSLPLELRWKLVEELVNKAIDVLETYERRPD
jgi:translation initiation factor 4G